LGDGDQKDRPENLCVDVKDGLPHCMDMVTPGIVIQRIDSYFQGGAVRYLTAEQSAHAQAAVGSEDQIMAGDVS
jgi:hypothetical protein